MSTIPESRTGGIAGLAAWLFRKCSKPEVLALYLVLAAGVLTVLKKNGVNIADYALYFGVALGIAALLYEMHSAKGMAKAFFYAKPGALAVSTFIWLCAFGYSVNSWIGAASESQAEKTNIHKAAFNASADVTEAEKAAKKRYDDAVAVHDRIEGKGSNGAANVKPWRSVSDATAIVEGAKAKWQWEASAGCTQAAKNTRKVCDEYRSAKADLDRWAELAKAKLAMADAEADWNEARKAKRDTKVVSSEGRDDNVILTKYAGMSEHGAQIFNGLFSIVAISIFLSFGSMKAEWDRLSETGQRRRFNFWLNVKRAWSWAMRGEEPENVTVQNVYNGTVDGVSRADMARAIHQQFGHRVAA